MRVAAMLALATASTAASTSAFAQSAEYRRGYEDGYAAALRGDRGDRGDRGRGQWGNVRVEEAQYGARRGACDARHAVRREVERNGTVLAGNHLCGDPAYNEEKRLTVVYRCGNDAPIQVTAREHETLRLSCRR
jgi:hypothetical protein